MIQTDGEPVRKNGRTNKGTNRSTQRVKEGDKEALLFGRGRHYF